MIERGRLTAETLHSIRTNPVTALLGPRQCGKTTLAREIGIDAAFFDLEDPISLRRLTDARLTLSPLRGLIVLDEIQRRPELFPILRVLADRKPLRARFLILGSASPELLQQSSESLAGRISFVELGGFGLEEVPTDLWKRLWMRGGFPRAFLTRTEADSASWKESFIRTFLERDIRDLGVEIPASRLQIGRAHV